MKDRKWIAFFSQTGAEISDLSEKLGYGPDIIVTNERPSAARSIDWRITETGKLIVLPNNPTPEEYIDVLEYFENPVVTLHGWLRIIPPYVCDEYEIYNGHPGLITEYPELKGKDPQIRAFEGDYKKIGSVIHKVTAGVDEGEIISQYSYGLPDEKLELDDYFRILRDLSLQLWESFLKLYK